MFFKRLFKQVNTRPAVKKVSQIINSKSHKQKKFISLMVVPSYSTGKTRTLRVPRALFHGVVAGMLVISAVVLGLNLRANHFERVAQTLDSHLYETETRYSEFRAYAEQVQDNLLEAAAQVAEELTETEIRAQAELSRQARSHQSELEVILDKIEEIENIIRDLDEDRQNFIDGLSLRGAIIPPVNDILAELEVSQAALRQLSLIHNPIVAAPRIDAVDRNIGFMSLGGNEASVTHCMVQEYLEILIDELYVQRKLMDCLESYRARMDVYLRNFPTLWPISGSISSSFGWRSNPFGGLGGEHHSGVDIPARTGTLIRASGGGIIVESGWRNGYGQTVIIDHGNGISTLYAHNSRNLVVIGQTVARGEVIAHVGSTGRSTAPHLHYEVKINGTAVNPVPFMNEHYS